MTNRDPRLDAKTAFYVWHDEHRSQSYADMTRDLENASGVMQNGFAKDSTEYWLAALSSARQSFADFADGLAETDITFPESQTGGDKPYARKS